MRAAQEVLRVASLPDHPSVASWLALADLATASQSASTKEPARPAEVPGPAPDDRLALTALWAVTDERIDLYHQIATGQARRSFFTAQLAMATGFVLLIVFAVLAVRARTPTAAVTTGGLGAVAAALAGYIGRTCVRSQESAASHLRAYFDQPLEFSRYLAAERLLAAASTELTGTQRAEVPGTLTQTIAVGSPNGQHVDGKDKKR